MWLLQSPEWINWLNRPDSDNFLWIHGIPGAGKTVLASFIIEQIKQYCNNAAEDGYSYYYCHSSNNQDEAGPFLRWIVSQFCRQAQWIPKLLKELFDQGCNPSIAELENVLEAVLRRFHLCYVIIDAVDESSPREDLIRVIATITLDKRFPNLKILATSRKDLEIERVFRGISIAVSMSNPSVERDIREFVKSKLSSRRMKRWEHLLGQIEDVLVAGAQGM